MNVFGRLFKASRAIAATALLLPKWQENQAVYEAMTFENFNRFGYQRNEIIYSCIRKTATTAASVALRVYDEGSDEVIDRHPLEMLLRKPNPFFSAYGFWDFTLVNLKLAGKMYWEKVRNNAGQVIELWPLRPDWVKVIPSERTFIGGYRYEPPGVNPIPIAASELLVFRHPDPLDIYKSLPPVQLAARVGDVDNHATDYIKLFWERGAMVLGALKTKERLTDKAATDMRKRWSERYGGFYKWFEPAILDQDAEYQRIGLNMQEMDFSVLDARNEARICAVLEVPPIIAGARVGLDASTYSNYEQARKSWWQDTLIPMYKQLSDQVDTDLSEDFGGGVYCEFDTTKTPAFMEDTTARWSRVTQAFTSGMLKLNEARVELGFDPDPNGDVYVRSLYVTASTADTPGVTLGSVIPGDAVQENFDQMVASSNSGTSGSGGGGQPTGKPTSKPTNAPANDTTRPDAMPPANEQQQGKSTPGVLPSTVSTHVEPFTQEEIDAAFTAWDKLPSLEELRKRVKRDA